MDFWGNIEHPWEAEPRAVFNTVEGYHIVVYRSQLGNLNGYVGVKRDHPLYGLPMNNKKLACLSVHGGVTFAGKIDWDSSFKNKYWYIGFDTAHYMDLVPSMYKMNREMGFPPMADGVYRDMQYVSNEVNLLASQIRIIKKRNPNFKLTHVQEYRRLRRIKDRDKKLRQSILKGL